LYPRSRYPQHFCFKYASQWHDNIRHIPKSWGTFCKCNFSPRWFVSPTCYRTLQCRSWYFPCPCLASCPTHDLKFGIRNFTAGIPNFSEFLVLQRSKGRSKHGNCACVWSLIAAVCHVERTHTHTHRHPIISVSGRGDVFVAADVSGAMLPPLRRTGHHHLLLRTVIPTGCWTKGTDRFLPGLGSCTGRIHGCYTQNVVTQNTHRHTLTHTPTLTPTYTAHEFATRRKVQVLPQRPYLETLIRYLRVFSDSAYLHRIIRITVNTVSDHLYSGRP